MKRIGHVAGWHKLFPDQTNGLRTSNESFLRALIQFGDFDQLDLFIPEPFLKGFREHWDPFLEKIGRKEALNAQRLWDIPVFIESKSYEIITVSDPLIDRLANLRWSIAKKPFPISGITHSLHGYGNTSHVLSLLTARTLPCDSIICTSLAGKKVMEKAIELNTQTLSKRFNCPFPKFSTRLDPIPLGVEAPTPTGLSKKEVRETLELPTEDPLILCNGRVSILTKMDHGPLLLALRELIKIPGLENTRLLIAGAVDMDSSYLGALGFRITQLGLEAHVFFKLNYESWVKPYLYEAADVVVSIPDNTQETFGVAPVEAMLMGKPVVVSRWDGHAELLEEGISGYSIPTYWAEADAVVDYAFPYAFDQGLFYMSQSVAIDVPILISRLQELLQDPQLRETLGKAAQAHAKAHFTWEKIIPRYMKHWQELHHIAQKLDWHTPSYKMEAPALHDIFGHYASHTLKMEDRLICTEYGKKIEERSETINLYPTVLSWINGPVVFQLLKLTKQACTLKELIDAVGHPAPITSYLILWAVKNHLLQLLPA